MVVDWPVAVLAETAVKESAETEGTREKVRNMIRMNDGSNLGKVDWRAELRSALGC